MASTQVSPESVGAESATPVAGRLAAVLICVAAFAALYASSTYSYLLFHSLAELFSVLVALSIFVIAWNARDIIDNNHLLFLGIAYLFVGAVDVFHTLAYSGMNVFPGYGSNLATQLWVSARFIESVSFLLAPFFLNRRLLPGAVLAVYAAATSILLASIFYWRVFPTCYVEGAGLTTFKKVCEYIIASLLLVSLVPLYKKRGGFEKSVFHLMVASVVVTIASEMAFTLYVSVYAFWNMAGHLLKILSFLFLYRALVYTGIRKPYSLLFHSLRSSEEQLRRAYADLEERIQERTADLSKKNIALREEIAERKRLERQIIEISEVEQRRIGQDLHDGVGQHLTGILFKSGLLAQTLSERGLAEAEAMEEVESLVGEAILQIRRLAKGLWPGDLKGDGLMAALQELALVVTDVFHVGCVFRYHSPVEFCDSTVIIHLYRIAQEAVNNAIKHGKAKNITITVVGDEDQTTLAVEDDGVGLSAPSAGQEGMGLRIMNYRARMLGGVCDIRHAPGGGAVVTCTCPTKGPRNSEGPQGDGESHD